LGISVFIEAFIFLLKKKIVKKFRVSDEGRYNTEAIHSRWDIFPGS
jgi:hypothetical protein